MHTIEEPNNPTKIAVVGHAPWHGHGQAMQLGQPMDILTKVAGLRRTEFITAGLQHRSELLSLNVAYASWAFSEIDKFFNLRCADVFGMEAPDYVASVLDKICGHFPPEGVFYLVKRDGRFSAMGGLRGLSADIAEIKRIYVHPDSRGSKLGELILDRLLDDATSFGYKRVRLETAPFMKSAHRIYESAGFVDRDPYPEAEVPKAFHERWRFMECSLTPRGEAKSMGWTIPP